jgi:formylglycine-generating enzyme required for sulfatase activity
LLRVLRGGSFVDYAVDVRSADRDRRVPGRFDKNVGFRPVRTIAVE